MHTYFYTHENKRTNTNVHTARNTSESTATNTNKYGHTQHNHKRSNTHFNTPNTHTRTSFALLVDPAPLPACERFEGKGSSFRPSTLESRMKAAAICRLFDTYIHPIQVQFSTCVCTYACLRQVVKP